MSELGGTILLTRPHCAAADLRDCAAKPFGQRPVDQMCRRRGTGVLARQVAGLKSMVADAKAIASGKDKE